MRLWDIEDGTLLSAIETGLHSQQGQSFLTFDRDGTALVVGVQGEELLVFSSLGKDGKFDDGSLIKKIFDTNTHSTYYILYYFYENNHYLIECGCGKIYIYNILTNELFKELKKEKNESDHYSACIINNNLCVSSDNGYIDIWDLNNGNLIKSINCKKSNFYGIISWNEKFLIVADSANYSFCIIDIKIGKKISNIGGIHQGGVICLKKIIHPIFGESLLSNDDEGDIKLWIINNILINYFSN